jgi:AbrB family looped-hinge helix DNA binding protein
MEEQESVLAERGQITIPKAIRTKLGLKPGARLQFELDRGKIIISKKISEDPIERVRGCIPYVGPSDKLIAELRGSK